MSPRESVPEPGELWQRIAVGFCEWVNGEWPDDDDIADARAPAKHIESYVSEALVEAFKRGVLYRETTNAPVPPDKDVLAKLRAAA